MNANELMKIDHKSTYNIILGKDKIIRLNQLHIPLKYNKYRYK